jgi:hypothetical protein
VQDKWLAQCEDYYRDTYSASMRAKVKAILPKNTEKLKALMDIIVADGEAWKKAVRVPDVYAVNKALSALYQQYPEFRAEAVDADKWLIEERTVDKSEAAEFMGALLNGMKNGKAPEQVYKDWEARTYA